MCDLHVYVYNDHKVYIDVLTNKQKIQMNLFEVTLSYEPRTITKQDSILVVSDGSVHLNEEDFRPMLLSFGGTC